MVSKMAWGIEWTFTSALESTKTMGSFLSKAYVSVSEELGIMTLKADAKFKGKLIYGLKKDTEFG